MPVVALVVEQVRVYDTDRNVLKVELSSCKTYYNMKKRILMRFLRVLGQLLFAFSITFIFSGKLVLASVLLAAIGILSILYGGPYAIFWILCSFGMMALGYGKGAFALPLLALATVIAVADMIMLAKALAKGGLKKVAAADKSKIYAAWLYFKRENEITCILWNRLMHTQRLRISATTQDEIVTRGDFENNVRVMTNDERKKVRKKVLMGLIIMIMIVSSMVCVLLNKIVLAGVLFVAVGVLNAFFMGLPFTIFLIIVGLMIISFGYEKRVFGLTLLVLVFLIATANVILMHKSILSGALERFGILAKSNRFAFFDYLRENEITCILLNKLKRRLKRK